MAAQRYEGGCHCGAVRFLADVDIEKPVISCNCSHCGKKGFLWSFIPGALFTLNAGEDAQSEYRFHTRTVRHQFCKTCGVESFADGKDMKGVDTASINVRCLDGVDVAALTIQTFDGANR